MPCRKNGMTCEIFSYIRRASVPRGNPAVAMDIPTKTERILRKLQGR